AVRDGYVPQDAPRILHADVRDEDGSLPVEQRSTLSVLVGDPDPLVVDVVRQPLRDVCELGQVTTGGGDEQRGHQRAPSPRTSTGSVFRRICRSKPIDLRSTYSMSSRSMSSVPRRLRPLTCPQARDAGRDVGPAVVLRREELYLP